jgi:hypothetical protein
LKKVHGDTQTRRTARRKAPALERIGIDQPLRKRKAAKPE